MYVQLCFMETSADLRFADCPDYRFCQLRLTAVVLAMYSRNFMERLS